jgi:hypothetical protein
LKVAIIIYLNAYGENYKHEKKSYVTDTQHMDAYTWVCFGIIFNDRSAAVSDSNLETSDHLIS